MLPRTVSLRRCAALALAVGLLPANAALAAVASCRIDPAVQLTQSDTARLADLAGSRSRSLAAAARDHDPEVDAAVAGLYGGSGPRPLAQPVPGAYRCRTIKLGGQDAVLGSVAYGFFQCRIARAGAGAWSIAKTTGSQNFSGELLPAGDGLVYRGASNYSYEPPRRYGDRAEENQVGCLYAAPTGTRHYLLELPTPRLESLHDVIELLPAK